MALDDKLRAAVATSDQSKWRRLVQMPYRTLNPIVSAKLNRIYETTAPTFFGEYMNLVMPEPVSVKIWRYGYFEKDVSFFLLNTLVAGDTFIDVGGHFGFYSLLGAHLVGPTGKTVSCEPMPKTRAILTKNMQRYVDSGVSSIVPKAIGRAAETVEFKDFGILGSAFATSMEARSSAMADHESVTVQVETLDAVLADKDLRQNMLIKIDAEGAEEAVLEGAGQTISTHRPKLILELGDSTAEDKANNRSRALIEMLEETYGYKTYEFSNWSLALHKKRDSYVYDNLFFVPDD